MADASLYDLLGVPPTAEPAELKKAYHQQCLKWHPDKHQGSAEARRRANNIFQRVTHAYEVLGGEVRRAAARERAPPLPPPRPMRAA
jgi:DnaJ family protein B protein 6